MSSYFLLLHSKWIAYFWGTHTPGTHGPPLETIGSRNSFSHRKGCFDLKRSAHFSYSAILQKVLKWIVFIEIHYLQAKSPLYKMWNVLSNSCEYLKHALLFNGLTVAKENLVSFRIFLGFNSAFTFNQRLSKLSSLWLGHWSFHEDWYKNLRYGNVTFLKVRRLVLHPVL